MLKDGKELSKQLEDWRQINDSSQRLTLTRLIDSRSLAPGDYEIQSAFATTSRVKQPSPSANLVLRNRFTDEQQNLILIRFCTGSTQHVVTVRPERSITASVHSPQRRVDVPRLLGSLDLDRRD